MSTSPTDAGSELSEAPAVPAPKHPRVKITPWRILNTAVLLILGTTKALSTFLGQTSAPNNLDWTIGVVWALISYWVSIMEQETPEVAPWFFTTDFSGVVRLGFTGFLIVLALATFWSVIYGLIALTFGRFIHPPVPHGLSVGFLGMIVLLLLVFAIARLARLLPRLRKSFKQIRFTRFYNRLFRRSDWVPNITFLLIYNGIMWLTPIGITVVLTTRSHHDVISDSEVANMLLLTVALIFSMIWSLILTFFIGVAFQMLFRWLIMLFYILQLSRLARYFPTRSRSARGDGSSGQPTALPLTDMSRPVPP
ncbi:hypothetical protein FB451DRAFT_1282032 [Mycena latifolia]|nr:hypothetical protein FB451DRAFT_1282032 [Mycena latifolia]